MMKRNIPKKAVVVIALGGEVIEKYPDDWRGPRELMLGWYQGNPIHLVRLFDFDSGILEVITVYRPDPRHWKKDWKTRKKRKR